MPTKPSLVAIALLSATTLTQADTAAYVFGHGTFGTPVDGTLAAIGDFDNDGRLDLVGVDAVTSTVHIELGQVGGDFLPTPIPTVLDDGTAPVAATPADLDADGNLDLVVVDFECTPNADCGPGSVLLLFGLGDGTFEVGPKLRTAPVPIEAAVADLDADGLLDIAVATAGSNILSDAPGFVTVIANRGNRDFKGVGDFAAGNGARGVRAAQVDDDGVLDLVVPQSPSLSNDAIAWLPGIGASRRRPGGRARRRAY